MKKVKNFIDILISILIYVISLVIPSRTNYWAFGARGGERYCDNPRYFMEWLEKNRTDECCYWVTKNKKEAMERGFLYFYSFKSWIIIASCNYIVCSHSTTGNDVYKFIRKCKVLVTLWHGIPIKKMGHIRPNKYTPFKKGPDIFLVPSRRDMKIFMGCYGLSESVFHIGQYPRITDLKRMWPKSNDKVIIYAPTFRDGQGQNYYLDKVFPTLKVLDDLDRELSASGYTLKVKLHPYTNATFPLLTKWSSIEVLGIEDDVQDILIESRILITDYSSIYFDFMNVNGRTIFYLPDHDWYMNENNRGLIDGFENIFGTNVAFNAEELLGSVKKHISIGSDAINDNENGKLLSLFFERPDSGNEDIYNRIKSHD